MVSGTIQPGDSEGTLVIRDVTESDNMFTCTGSNGCGDDTATLRILVQGRQIIEHRNILCSCILQ